MTEIIIDNGVSEPGLTELDLSRFPMLKRLVIGDHCLSYVEREDGWNERVGECCGWREQLYKG